MSTETTGPAVVQAEPAGGAAGSPHAPERASTAGASLARVRGLWDAAGMLAVFVVLFIGVSLFVHNFFSIVNMRGLALSVATVGIISCTMLFCLAAGDFDLSVGSVVAMSGVLTATVMNYTHSIALGVVIGIAAGGIVGLFNGFVIARLGINALITTLATMRIVRGIAFIICDGKTVGVSQESFFSLGNAVFLGIPAPVWVMILCFVAFGILLNRTIFGRNTLAVGGNSEAARLAGIPVVRLKIIIFMLQGMMAAFAGIILASRMTSGQPNTAQGLELDVISACVLGGVSLTGGVGTIVGVAVGVLIMGTVQNVLNLLNINSFAQLVVTGSILLAAVLLDKLKQTGVR